MKSMFRKISLLIMAVLIAACGGNKQVARSTTYKKPTSVVRNVRKPAVKKPVAHSRTTQSNQGNQSAQKPEILEATTKVKVTTEIVFDYIGKYKEIAKNNMAQYGIPASIILGQGILESGAGTGPLSMLANNHFGIKCHKEWTGPSVAYDDDAAGECFRKYDDASKSYQDHSLFLTSRDRYSFLFNLDKRDYQGWARGLKAAGYATDPKYPEKLIGIIERYQLNRYDAEVTGDEFVPLNTKPLTQVPQMPNNIDTYEVVKGDTLYSISKKFNLSVDELRQKNNISENAISIGQILKIK